MLALPGWQALRLQAQSPGLWLGCIQKACNVSVTSVSLSVSFSLKINKYVYPWVRIKRNIKLHKPDTKGHVLYDDIYMKHAE